MDAVAPRNLPSPCVVVLVGPGASGKSTWAASHFPPDSVISSDRLRALVETLLDVSRLATRGLRLSLEEVDLSEVVREAAASFAEQSTRANCPLTLRADESAFGRWDRLRVEQVPMLDGVAVDALWARARGEHAVVA